MVQLELFKEQHFEHVGNLILEAHYNNVAKLVHTISLEKADIVWVKRTRNVTTQRHEDCVIPLPTFVIMNTAMSILYLKKKQIQFMEVNTVKRK